MGRYWVRSGLTRLSRILLALLAAAFLTLPDIPALASLSEGMPLAIGEAVTFGHYEQDNDMSNGKEPIRWIVLNEKDGWVWLLSEKVLDCMPYNARYRKITWETSEVRAWLNREFINAAFTPKERNAILTRDIRNNANPYEGTSGGNDTADRVHLLSIREAEGFGGDDARRARYTEYARARGADDFYGIGYTNWYLRSPGAPDEYLGDKSASGAAAYVNYYGTVWTAGVECEDPGGVRPAIFVDAGLVTVSRGVMESIASGTPDANQPYQGSDADGLKPGDIINLGHYEQDNDAADGTEQIRWIVLAWERGTALVISEKNLDVRPYDAGGTSVTWEACSLRAWLNGEFLNTAFTAQERKSILAVEQKAGDNPRYGTKGGRDATDRVFLLSISAAEGMFGDDAARLARNTAYAKARGAQTGDGGTTGWWLLSIGASDGLAAFVDRDGSIDMFGERVIYPFMGVRPAMCVHPGAGGF